ncbi:hypothetical protein DENSPDRAFT_852784 [Dentipellis sp. KUC8613]|nr:hypothetical protein DENSPDRAFT_852784 [Dentipellis sp. KUC8613]
MFYDTLTVISRPGVETGDWAGKRKHFNHGCVFCSDLLALSAPICTAYEEGATTIQDTVVSHQYHREGKYQRLASASQPSENKPKPGSRYRRVRDEFDTKGPFHTSPYQRGRAPSRGLLSSAHDSQETIKAPAAGLQHCLELLYDYYGRMRAFSRFHKPSFVVVEPEDGDVDMPSREYVDAPEQVIRPLPEPARLAPPATAWDGTVLDEDEYIAVLEVSADSLPSAESSFVLVEDSSDEETPRMADSAVFVDPLPWTGYDSDTEDQEDDDDDDERRLSWSLDSSYVLINTPEPTQEEFEKCLDEVIAEYIQGNAPRDYLMA